MKKLLAAIFLVTMAGCTSLGAGDTLEVIHGIELREGTLTALVTSTGCTNQSSFEVKQDNEMISVIRVRPDHCRRMPFATWVSLTQVGNQEFRLRNPIALPGPDRKPVTLASHLQYRSQRI